MDIEKQLATHARAALQELYAPPEEDLDISINQTRKDFEGDFTIVTFPLTRISKKSPEQTAEDLGKSLQSKHDFISKYNVVKGFLNLSFETSYWLEILNGMLANDHYGQLTKKDETIVVEYCGPNTNKPLHLGHIRNMLLGHSVSTILAANGYDVKKVNIYNDRGIAICKSMVAWLRMGQGKTPQDVDKKGDHFVGDYYVAYSRLLEEEVSELMKSGKSAEEAGKTAGIYRAAQEMLLKWEAGDPETLELWKRMNNWVYKGFEATYQKLGVDFDKAYYESDTYLDGKAIVAEGLEKGVYYKKADGSTWVDLTEEGLDEKILIRSDGTAVYLTQDLGTAQERFNDYQMKRSIYVVANEQDYHFKVLKLTLQKLEKPYAEGIYHLSYGMVDLPSGKMKSREGTTVDADHLIAEMESTAEEHTKALGKIEGLSDAEASQLFTMIGLGALKYFILKVNPKKRMLFNPEESIDLQGDTGPFIQYTHARIKSMLRDDQEPVRSDFRGLSILDTERQLIIQLYLLPHIVKEAGDHYDPSIIANYTFNLAKLFNKFYAEAPILKAEKEIEREFRLALSHEVAHHIRFTLNLLGIEAPERM